MRKVLVVAATELGMAVRTKAFLVWLLLLPLLIGVSVAAQTILVKKGDTRPKRFAVVDRTGVLYDPLAARAEARNAILAAGGDVKLRDMGPRFEPEKAPPGGSDEDALRLELSERVRRGHLFAFVEIPREVLAPPGAGRGGARIRYHSDHPTYSDLRRWLTTTLGDEIRRRRFQEAGLDQALVARLDAPVEADEMGLLHVGEGGKAVAAEKVDKLRTLAIPSGLALLLLMVVMTGAPGLLNSVLEEKMSRISEVLLGSVTPFELMMGKLLGSAGVSMILGALYVGGALAVASRYGYASAVPPLMLIPFVGFLVLGVLLFGSLYVSVGAACTELKDAQTLMMPVMLVTMMPVFGLSAVMQNPSSGFSVGLSLFPPATPFIMFLRMALRPSPPGWQVALGVGGTVLTTIACVWAASRIFRVGLLVQGKSATFGQMLRWIWAR